MKKIVEAFDTVKMPESCETAIRREMKKKQSDRGAYRRLRPIPAALAAVVLMLCFSTEVRAAVKSWTVKYFFPGSDITICEMLDENGDVVEIAGVDTDAPPFARIVNGRLYFVGNNEKIDITNQIKEDAPYFYSYVDDYGLTHYMAVGYAGTMENYGIYEFIREENGDWVTGTGRNFLSMETETRYPWVDLVWEEFDVPWPMPE